MATIFDLQNATQASKRWDLPIGYIKQIDVGSGVTLPAAVYKFHSGTSIIEPSSTATTTANSIHSSGAEYDDDPGWDDYRYFNNNSNPPTLAIRGEAVSVPYYDSGLDTVLRNVLIFYEMTSTGWISSDFGPQTSAFPYRVCNQLQEWIDTGWGFLNEFDTYDGRGLSANLPSLALWDGNLESIGLDTSLGVAGWNYHAARDLQSMTLTQYQLADRALARDWTETEIAGGIAARSTLNALRFLRNKWTVASNTLSVKKEDDSTEAWSGSVTHTAGVNPVTAVDPA